MRKFKLAIGSTAVALSLIAAGCSGDSGEESSGGPIALEAYTVYLPNSPQGQALDWLYSEYNKSNPAVMIKSVAVPQNLQQKLQAMATTNSLPDIAMIDNPDYPVLAATGKLTPLNDSLQEWGLADSYIPGAQEVVTNAEGQTGGVFIGTNTLAILYNKDLFKKAGITETPKTWSEFEAAGKKLATGDVTGFSFSAINNGCTTWHFNPWQWSAGGSDDNLTDAGNVKALTFTSNLVKSGISSKDVVNQCQDEGMQALVQGQTAMIENGPWSFNTLNAAENLNWGSFPIPVPEAGDKLVVPLGGEVWTLPQTGETDREKAALAFLKWSQTPEVLQQFNEKLGYVPVMSSLWPAVEQANPDMKSFIDSLEYARGRTTVLGTKTPTQVTALSTAIQQAILGQASPEKALADAQAQLG